MTARERTADELRQALAAPFEPSEVKFKPQTVSGNRALAVPFVDVRAVMDRLDEVFGVGGWQSTCREARGGVICTLSVRIGGEWVIHEDIGGFSEQSDEGDREKAAVSDSIKRAAIHLGIGRYLYRARPQWCDYDPQKRQFTQQPRLPQPASQATAVRQQPKEHPGERSIQQRVEAFEASLVAQGMCKAGELFKHLGATVGARHQCDVAQLPATSLAEVQAEVKRFHQEKKQTAGVAAAAAEVGAA